MLYATKQNDSLILEFQLVLDGVIHRLLRVALHLLNY